VASLRGASLPELDTAVVASLSVVVSLFCRTQLSSRYGRQRLDVEKCESTNSDSVLRRQKELTGEVWEMCVAQG
jgi:hypothetical protein